MTDTVNDNQISLTSITVVDTPVLSVSPLAAQSLQKLLADKQLPDHGLRVFVAGGGCSGMQYGMAIEGDIRDSDKIVEMHGVRLIVDPMSLPHLEGATIDYEDNLMGGGFRISNPNAVSTCGCGTSFRTAGSPAASGGGCGI